MEVLRIDDIPLLYKQVEEGISSSSLKIYSLESVSTIRLDAAPIDVAFCEDASRKRTGNAAQDFSVLSKIALNLLRQDKAWKGKDSKLLTINNYLVKILGFKVWVCPSFDIRYKQLWLRLETLKK